MSQALVIANGVLPSVALLRELAVDADLIVGADGGADGALAAGLRVDAIVGDLDSASDAAKSGPGVEVVQDADVDHTDLEKAVAFCIARGATRVGIAGAGGGRADHALANLSVLRQFRGRADLRLIDDLFETRLAAHEADIEGPPGTVVSLVAVGRCEGVTTHGLRWELHERALDFSPYGIHNEVASQPAWVRVRSGDLYLFVGRWVERHETGERDPGLSA